MTEKTEGIKIEDAVKDEQPLQEETEETAKQAEEADAKAGEAGAETGTQESGEAGKESEEADAAGEKDGDSAASGDDSQEKAEPADDARYLRLLAEFQNYKKRTQKEKTDLYSYANEKIMTELLEVLDNFERALDAEPGEGFKEGMELIFTQLSGVLSKAGLAEITALGEDFDPNVHNAVMAEETDEYESGKVSGVMQKGYTLNGKVIRPSMVKVAN